MAYRAVMITNRPQFRGPDLKAERVRRGLTQNDIAERLGVTRTRVTAIEGAWRPAATIVHRYLAVLGAVE